MAPNGMIRRMSGEAQATAGPGAGEPAEEPSALRRIADSPLAGIAPWIVFSVLCGITSFEVAVGAALGVAVLGLVVGRLGGGTLKPLELVDVVLFVVLAVIGALVSDRASDWLETWAGEISNLALVAIAVGSMLVRRPFTLDYAKEQVPERVWSTPAFLRTNYVVTGAWAAAFTVSAISGFIGDAVLDDSDNIWTGWIIQIAALLVAIQFTVWYPRVARARARQEAGIPTDPPPPVSELLTSLAGYLPAVGVVVLVADARPWWVGLGLIVAGALIGRGAARDIGRARERRAGASG
jgi:hypothetical protein